MRLLKDLDVVALLCDVPNEHLTRGETGTVVFDFGDGIYLVEFADKGGETYSVVELRAEQLLLLHMHERAEISA